MFGQHRTPRSSLLARGAAVACVIGLASALVAPATNANAATSPTVSIVSATVNLPSTGTVDDTFAFTVATNVAASRVEFTISPETTKYSFYMSGGLATNGTYSVNLGVSVNTAKTVWTVKMTLKPGTRVATFTAYDAAGLPSLPKSVTVPVRGMLLVNFGESFGAGLGVPPFDSDGTKCYRSTAAFGRLLDADTSLAVPLQMAKGGFRDCAGAVAENVLTTPQNSLSDAKYNNDSKFNEVQFTADIKAQIAGYPTLIVMTMGGNDLQYDDYMTCLVLSIGKNSDKTCEDKILGLVKGNTGTEVFAETVSQLDPTDKRPVIIKDVLRNLYVGILSNDPKSKLLIVGYPQLTSNVKPDDNVCGKLSGTNGRLYKLGESLNLQISKAVTAAAVTYPGRVFFVDPNAAGSPFIGHDLCAKDPYFNKLTLPYWKYSYHPNAAGHQAYEKVIATWIAGNAAALNK